MYLITDPDRLAQVFEWIMGEKRHRDRKNIQCGIERSEEGSRLFIFSKFDDQHPFAGNSSHPQGCSMSKASFCPIPLMSESGLEMRACRTVVEALEGSTPGDVCPFKGSPCDRGGQCSVLSGCEQLRKRYGEIMSSLTIKDFGQACLESFD